MKNKDKFACNIPHCSLCNTKKCKLEKLGFSYNINLESDKGCELTKLEIAGKNKKIQCGNLIVRCLCILAENFNTPVSKESISLFVWPRRVIGQNSVPVLINELRKILLETDFRIITLRGIGYVLMEVKNG